MDADPILRVFGKATDSHRAMQSSAGVPAAVCHGPSAHDDDRMHSGAQERPEPPRADDADGMVLPLPAPRRRFAHHGYQAARQELEDWRHAAASEAAEAQEGAGAAASAPMQAPSPQRDADASAVAVAEHAAKLAWQQAAQAAQLAAGQQAGHAAGSWLFPPWAEVGQEPPPQPPPPPSFALAECGGASTVRQSPGSSTWDTSMKASAAAHRPHGLQETEVAAGTLPEDDGLSGLLSAWYKAGYETGRYNERRLQHARMPQSVN